MTLPCHFKRSEKSYTIVGDKTERRSYGEYLQGQGSIGLAWIFPVGFSEEIKYVSEISKSSQAPANQ